MTRGLVLCAAGLVSSAGMARAQPIDTFWANGSGGAWSLDGNWSPATAPNNNGPTTYNAILDALGGPYVVTLDIPVEIENFSMLTADASLDVTNESLIVNQTFLADVGTIFSSGAGGTITVDGSLEFGDVTVISAGAITSSSSSSLKIAPLTMMDLCDTCVDHGGAAATWENGGTLALNQNAELINGPSSSMAIASDANKTVNGDGTGSLINQGSMTLLPGPGPVWGGLEPMNPGVGPRPTRPGINFTVEGAGFQSSGAVDVLEGVFDLTQITNFLTVGGALNEGAWRVLPVADGRDAALLFPTADLIDTLNTEVVMIRNTSSFPALDGLATVGPAGVLSIGLGRNFIGQGQIAVQGEVVVGDGSVLDLSNGWQNLDAGQVFGGRYTIAGQLLHPPVGGINGLQGAQVRLIGPTSFIPGIGGLSQLGPGSLFSVENGRAFTTTSDFNVIQNATLRVGQGSSFQISGQLLNFQAQVLFGGNFEVAGSLVGGFGMIDTLASARVLLAGANAQVLTNDLVPALQSLGLIDADSVLEIRGDQSLGVDGPLQVDGQLVVGAGATSFPPPNGSGVVDPGLVIQNNLVITRGSVVVFEFAGGVVDADNQIQVGGGLFFENNEAGTLRLEFDPSDSPETVKDQALISASFVAGQFFQVQFVGATPQRTVTVDYDGTNVLLNIKSCPADINGDRILDNGDISAFINLFLHGATIADMNGDGILDNGDISRFVESFLGGC